jgi:hypothetical protein
MSFILFVIELYTHFVTPAQTDCAQSHKIPESTTTSAASCTMGIASNPLMALRLAPPALQLSALSNGRYVGHWARYPAAEGR